MDKQIRKSFPIPSPLPLHPLILPSSPLLAHAKNRDGLLEVGSSVKEGLCMPNKQVEIFSFKSKIRDDARVTQS